MHPTIYAAKQLVKEISDERGLVLFCDLHGHSRQQNVFMYGCNNAAARLKFRLFPFMLSKINPNFEFLSCKFGVQPSKEGTSMIALYKLLEEQNPCIFTLESTFAGLDYGEDTGYHMTTSMLQRMGRDLCRTLLLH